MWGPTRNNVWGKTLSFAITFSVVLSALTIIGGRQIEDDCPRAIITVDDSGGADFLDIPPAVAYANEWDTIYVFNGTYSGSEIDKNLTIEGESKEGVYINNYYGAMEGPTSFEIIKDYTQLTIMSVTLASYNIYDLWMWGIDWWWAVQVNINDCKIMSSIIHDQCGGMASINCGHCEIIGGASCHGGSLSFTQCTMTSSCSSIHGNFYAYNTSFFEYTFHDIVEDIDVRSQYKLRVVDPIGSPLSGAEIYIEDVNGMPVGIYLTDGTGWTPTIDLQVILQSWFMGIDFQYYTPYNVTITWNSIIQSFDVDHNWHRFDWLEYVFDLPISFNGRVIDSGGQYIEGAYVRIWNNRTGQVVETTTDFFIIPPIRYYWAELYCDIGDEIIVYAENGPRDSATEYGYNSLNYDGTITLIDVHTSYNPGPIVINEVMFDNSTGEEWIELYNPSSSSHRISFWEITDEDGNNFTIPAIPEMPPDSYVVMHNTMGTSDTYFGETQPNALHCYSMMDIGEWSEYRIEANLQDQQSIRCADVDDDGLMDVVVLAYEGGFGAAPIYWYKCPANPFVDGWSRYTITLDVDEMVSYGSLVLADIDQDANVDVVIGTIWYEAPDDPVSGTWTKHEVRSTFEDVSTVADIDNDNDLDIVVAGYNIIFWLECPPDPTAQAWTEHLIEDVPGGASMFLPFSIDTGYIDDGPNIDVVVNAQALGVGPRRMWWYLNPGGAGSWVQYLIETGVLSYQIELCDVDADGRPDIIEATTNNGITWLKCPSSPVSTYYWEPTTIMPSSQGGRFSTGDIDGDQLLDLVICSNDNDDLYWCESMNSNGSTWVHDTICPDIQYPRDCHVGDFDSDGLLDVTALAHDVYDIYWYENPLTISHDSFDYSDQCSLYALHNHCGQTIVDFIAWGAPAGVDDDNAVGAGTWTNNDYLSLSGYVQGDTIGRDKDSIDTNNSSDWEHSCGIDSSTPTPGLRNLGFSVNMALDLGWNLISLPLTPSNNTIEVVLQSIAGKYDFIRTYSPLDPNPWKSYCTYKPNLLNDLKILNHKIGFWIHTTEANVDLMVFGNVSISTSITLYAGWNLVGYPSLNTETVGTALWGTGADRVMISDTSEPYHIREVGSTYVMKPGEGYWIHVPFDTIWIVDW